MASSGDAGVVDLQAGRGRLAYRIPGDCGLGLYAAIRKVGVVDAQVGALAGEGGRHVVDVAAAAVVVDHAAHREGVGDQRHVQHRGDIGIRVTAGGDAVATGDRALRDVHLRLVGDVADHARLGAGAEQGSLRALQDLDTFQVCCVHVEVAAWQLSGLVVQVDGDVREAVDRAPRLGALVTNTQTAHEDVCLPRPGGGCGDVGQVLDQVVEVVTFSWSRASLVKACIAIGTSWEFSERRCAVTTTS